MGKKLIDLTGRTFGKLVVLKRAPNKIYRNGESRVTWLCKCYGCGNEVAVISSTLINGTTTSCRCSWKKTSATHKNWKGYGKLSGQFWDSIVGGAAKRNIPITITIKDAWELFLAQNQLCAISGEFLQFTTDSYSSARIQTASLDRIDSTGGYVKGNVQWIHKDIQFMKGSFTQERLIYWCHRIVDRHSSSMSTIESSTPKLRLIKKD
jgi:hypothetical protein